VWGWASWASSTHSGGAVGGKREGNIDAKRRSPAPQEAREGSVKLLGRRLGRLCVHRHALEDGHFLDGTFCEKSFTSFSAPKIDVRVGKAGGGRRAARGDAKHECGLEQTLARVPGAFCGRNTRGGTRNGWAGRRHLLDARTGFATCGPRPCSHVTRHRTADHCESTVLHDDHPRTATR
jgi:hypothetical protein